MSDEPDFITRCESRILMRQPKLEFLTEDDVYVASVGLDSLIGRVVTAEVGDGCVIFLTPDGMRHEVPPATVAEFASILRQMADRLVAKHYIEVLRVEAPGA